MLVPVIYKHLNHRLVIVEFQVCQIRKIILTPVCGMLVLAGLLAEDGDNLRGSLAVKRLDVTLCK